MTTKHISPAAHIWITGTIAALEKANDDWARENPSAFPNRAIRRAALAGRHTRACWLWDRHDERSMFRALTAPST